MQWKAWVARKVVVPLIVGNGVHDQKSVIDYRNYIWTYDGEEIPFQIEQKQRRYGDIMTVVVGSRYEDTAVCGNERSRHE